MVLTTKGKVTIALIIVAVIAIIGAIVYFASQGSANNAADATAMVSIVTKSIQSSGYIV